MVFQLYSMHMQKSPVLAVLSYIKQCLSGPLGANTSQKEMA